MSLFLDKNKRRKSPLGMFCFLLSIVYLFIYAAAYALLVGPLYRHLTLDSVLATNILHSVLIAAAGTAVTMAAFLLPDKRIAAGAHLSLAVILVIFYLSVLLLDEAQRAPMAQLITIYGLAPVLIGNAAAWTFYGILRKKYKPVEIKTLREEILEAKEEAKLKSEAADVRTGDGGTAQTDGQDVPTEREALFGPEAGEDGGYIASRTEQEEAELFYKSDEESND